MSIKTKNWTTGTGSATIQYDGQGDGEIIITSDPNSNYEARSMQIVVETTDGSGIQRVVTINQAAKQRIDISAAVVTASNQTYSGSAKTPTPTVTLNGTTIPSSGYDVTYSNNTNAGTATITVTGKGAYTGTATGTFTINKASRTLSFADSYMVLNTSGTGTKTATPSAGGGDGAITYSIANTTYATINSSTGAVTAKTSDGSVIVTATIAEGQNYLGATSTYTLYVFATTHNYSYSGSARNVTLPPGTYQFQCWGAQGASCSDGYNGGKGGYSVGQLSIANALAIQVLVGGQNGYNGGGSSTSSSSYNSGDTYGRSSMGNGGGASDIRLSDGALLSRMIVAGGGSGGAYCYKKVTTTEEEVIGTIYPSASDCYLTISGVVGSSNAYWDSASESSNWVDYIIDVSSYKGKKFSAIINEVSQTGWWGRWIYFCKNTNPEAGQTIQFTGSAIDINGGGTFTGTIPSDANFMCVTHRQRSGGDTNEYSISSITLTQTRTVTSEDSDYQSGYAGGGTNGAGYSSSYYGKQNAAGSGGSFGQGANQTTSGYRYCSGAGGGGWYGGGGGRYSDSSMSYIHYSGGGSGWVNTSASAGNRPSGYTGIELDSGTTYAGNTSFPSTGGGTETGHSGNGYAKITRLE